MNIIYGLSGEGYGHSSRARLIIPFLQKLGHKVKILTYNKGIEELGKDFDVFEIHGTRLIFSENRISKHKTLFYNLRNFPKNYLERQKIKKLIKNFKPNLFITDYEPLTYLLSKIYHLPIISIGNHHIINLLEINIPKKYHSQYLLTKTINKTFTPSADYFIITSLVKPSKKPENTFIIPPFVREKIKIQKTSKKNYIFVYLNNAEYILPILKKINEKFIVYGFNVNKKEGNLEFKTKETFTEDLAKSKAIIATAGFSLISEAIYLKKPYLAIPQKGQFEQIFNALTIKELKIGNFSENLTPKQITSFLKNIKFYNQNLKKQKHNFNEIYTILENLLKKFEKQALKT